MSSTKLTFPNADGVQLAARLDLPLDEPPIAYALFAHCFTCTMNLKAVANISRALTAEGIAVLRFDFTGLGESEGEFADTNFSSNVQDLIAAARFLDENYDAPKVLIGHSLGGAAVLQAASAIPSSLAVATIAAPCSPEHLARLLRETDQEPAPDGTVRITLGGQTFTIKQQFLDDLDETRMQESIRTLRKALLIFHSPIDQVVGVEHAARIFQAAKHPKSFISLDRADHLLSDQRDSRYVGLMIAAWARKYIDTPRPTARLKPLSEQHVVAQTGAEGFFTEVVANGTHLLADEPVAYGGTDLGPTPYDYLLSGLGACTSMTMRMYADRKGWPLKTITVHLRHQKIHARDCEECETRQGKVDQIEREIEITGPLDDEQRARLIEIADRCPVHRTLHSEIQVKTSLKQPEM
ncbi:MAG: alpha/beta fold hydrolase [Chloroflexaceae bacterium]